MGGGSTGTSAKSTANKTVGRRRGEASEERRLGKEGQIRTGVRSGKKGRKAAHGKGWKGAAFHKEAKTVEKAGGNWRWRQGRVEERGEASKAGQGRDRRAR